MPLAISLASLPACSTTEQRAEASQSAAPVEVRATAIPAAAPAPEVTTAGAIPAKVATNNPATLVDRYTVMPGDTLSGIAARQDVYNDARLWPLLYRANVSQIGPGGLIFPNQTLFVDRKYTREDVKELTGRPKAAITPAAAAAKPAVEPQPVVTATAPATTASSAPAAPAEPTAKDTPAASVKSEVPPPAQSAQQGKAAAPPAGQAPQGAPAASVKASDYLIGARTAFAAGDTQWAIYYYSIYLDQRNNDAGAWGELGNVNYLDGNLPEAAKAYFNAANLLIDRGQTGRAMVLLPAIEEGDPRLSDAIHLRLTTIKR
ncbi:MAG: LysM peptidoglycan-binding domain-containing protein [Azonexus sp.]